MEREDGEGRGRGERGRKRDEDGRGEKKRAKRVAWKVTCPSPALAVSPGRYTSTVS